MVVVRRPRPRCASTCPASTIWPSRTSMNPATCPGSLIFLNKGLTSTVS